MEHPLTRQLAPFRAGNEIDHMMTMALRRRLVRYADAMWEVVEVYGGPRTDRRLAIVRAPRRTDWVGAEIYFIRPGDLQDALVDGPYETERLVQDIAEMVRFTAQRTRP